MKQIKVAITDETKAYLDEQAQKNGRNLSEEVRVRLDQSEVDDRFDAATKEFGRDMMWLAKLLEGNTADDTFTTDRRRLEALKKAVGYWLDDRGSRLTLESTSKIDPESWGKAIAHAYAQLKPLLIMHRPGGDNLPTTDNVEGKR
jgi:hypothetical protein